MLQIFLKDGSWMVDFDLSSRRAEILRLFETTILPSAFTSQSSASKVLHEISVNNPDETVVMK